MSTIGTKIRNGLGILSANGKRAWSEDGRGGLYGFMDLSKWTDQNKVMVDLGFDLIVEDDVCAVWDFHGQRVVFQKYLEAIQVYCSYLLADKSWCSEPR